MFIVVAAPRCCCDADHDREMAALQRVNGSALFALCFEKGVTLQRMAENPRGMTEAGVDDCTIIRTHTRSGATLALRIGWHRDTLVDLERATSRRGPISPLRRTAICGCRRAATREGGRRSQGGG